MKYAPLPLLLKPVGTIYIPATIEKFVVREKFVVNTSSKYAKISYIGYLFSKWFLNKIEEPKPETHLQYADLLRASSGNHILAELGEKKETTLAEIFDLMIIQPTGEDDVLFTNDYNNNIFCVRDVNNELRGVRVWNVWNNDSWSRSISWRVGAFLVNNMWPDGIRVFSRG